MRLGVDVFVGLELNQIVRRAFQNFAQSVKRFDFKSRQIVIKPFIDVRRIIAQCFL